MPQGIKQNNTKRQQLQAEKQSQSPLSCKLKTKGQ
jgi:hypothetical protein